MNPSPEKPALEKGPGVSGFLGRGKGGYDGIHYLLGRAKKLQGPRSTEVLGLTFDDALSDRFAVGIDDAHLTQTERSDTGFDFGKIADNDPGERPIRQHRFGLCVHGV